MRRRRRRRVPNAIKDSRRGIRRLIEAAENGDERAAMLVEKHGLKKGAAISDGVKRHGKTDVK